MMKTILKHSKIYSLMYLIDSYFLKTNYIVTNNGIDMDMGKYIFNTYLYENNETIVIDEELFKDEDEEPCISIRSDSNDDFYIENIFRNCLFKNRLFRNYVFKNGKLRKFHHFTNSHIDGNIGSNTVILNEKGQIVEFRYARNFGTIDFNVDNKNVKDFIKERLELRENELDEAFKVLYKEDDYYLRRYYYKLYHDYNGEIYLLGFKNNLRETAYIHEQKIISDLVYNLKLMRKDPFNSELLHLQLYLNTYQSHY